MKIALGSRSSSCMNSSSAQVQYLVLLDKTVNIWVALGGWVPRNLRTEVDDPKHAQSMKYMLKHMHQNATENHWLWGTGNFPQAWYRYANTGSNAEHRMSPCPPKYTNRNVNKMPIPPSNTHTHTQTPSRVWEKRFLCLSFLSQPKPHFSPEEVSTRKSQTKTLPYWLSNRDINRGGLRFDIFP